MTNTHPTPTGHRFVLGLAFIGLGLLATLDRLSWFEPSLLRTLWPLAFVLFGVLRLARPGPAGSRVAGLALIAVGAWLTAHQFGLVPFSMRDLWPLIAIGIGVALLAGRGAARGAGATRMEDRVAVGASFANLMLRSDSPRFQGGRLALNFGQAELDLSDASIDGAEAVLEMHARFSGVTLRVPRGWQVVAEVSTVFGDMQDHSVAAGTAAPRLVLRGDAWFSSLDVRH